MFHTLSYISICVSTSTTATVPDATHTFLKIVFILILIHNFIHFPHIHNDTFLSLSSCYCTPESNYTQNEPFYTHFPHIHLPKKYTLHSFFWMTILAHPFLIYTYHKYAWYNFIPCLFLQRYLSSPCPNISSLPWIRYHNATHTKDILYAVGKGHERDDFLLQIWAVDEVQASPGHWHWSSRLPHL